jgi:hypothetical protein
MTEAWEIAIISAAFLYTTGGYLFCWALWNKLVEHIAWDYEQHRDLSDLRERVERLEARRGTQAGS